MLNKQRLEQLSVQAVTALAFISGVVALFEPLVRRIPLPLGMLELQFHFIIIHRALSLVLGFTLLYLSYQLAQRKRAAWWAALAITLYLVLSAVLVRGDEVTALFAYATLGALLLSRNHFTARTEPQSLRQGIVLLVLSVTFALIYGVVGFELLDQRDFGSDFSLGTSISRTVREYILIGNDDLHPHTRYARGFLDSLDLIGVASLGFGLYSLFRPLSYTLRVLPHDREEVRRLLQTYGDLSEGHLKLWPGDKSYWFTSNHSAAVAYQVSSGVALTIGAPVGSARSRSAAVAEFQRICQQSGWEPAFLMVPSSGLKLFPEGWRRLTIGEDAIVPLEHFTTTVATNKHFRNVANRFDKAGASFSVHQPPHSRVLLRELQEVSQAWMASGKQQWALIQGRFDPVYLDEGPLYVLRDADGVAIAFANGIDPYVSGQSTIDLMRYTPDAPSNTMDFLLMRILQHCHEAGYISFNLGLAPLTMSPDAQPTTPEDRIVQLIGRLNQNFLAVGGLRRFKNKYEPNWDSQYIMYRGLPTNLVRIALALARATRL
jgi:phosphatidylglycerol lysyltransferase